MKFFAFYKIPKPYRSILISDELQRLNHLLSVMQIWAYTRSREQSIGWQERDARHKFCVTQTKRVNVVGIWKIGHPNFFVPF